MTSLNKKFIKYAIFAVSVTYAATYISINDKPKISYGDTKEVGSGKVSASTKNFNINSKKINEHELVAEGAYFTPVLNNEGTKILFSNGDDIFEFDLNKKNTKQLTSTGNCYNPVYNRSDNNIITFARNDGIYTLNIKEKKIKAIVSTSDPEISFAKPNFTREGSIIYYRVKVLPKSDGHGFIEKDPAIYEVTLDGKHEEKVTDGYNPTLSNDGVMVAYEWKDNLCLMNLENKTTKTIDNGKYASISHDGKYISYARYDRDTIKYKKVKSSNNLFVDKEYSNIYIVDISNLKNKHKITKEEYEDKNEDIDSWANDVKKYDTEQHFLVVSKMSYFDTAWSVNNNELYVSCYNADKGDFQLIKFNIGNE